MRPPIGRGSPAAGTTFRFGLLVMSVLGAAMFLYSYLLETQPAYRRLVQETFARCQSEATGDSISRAFTIMYCVAPVYRLQAWPAIGGTAVVALVAAAVYWCIPAWKIRRQHLVPLRGHDAPELADYLEDLAGSVGLRHRPGFLVRPFDPVPSGLAFGRFHRYHICLSAGLITLFSTDRPGFRAVVLHELAHLRNRDVDVTYLTVAIWRAFVAVALLPLVAMYALSLAVPRLRFDSWTVHARLGADAVALTLLVYLVRASVLRRREAAADRQAEEWAGADSALGRVLLALHRPSGTRRRLWLHPAPAARLRLLGDPAELTRIGPVEMLATGLTLTVATAAVDGLLGQLFFPEGEQPRRILAILSAPLIVAFLGTRWWLASAPSARRDPSRRDRFVLARAAGCFTAGVLLGEVVRIDSAPAARTELFSGGALTWRSTSTAPGLGLRLVLVLLVWGTVGALMRWLALAALAWRDGASCGRPPRWALPFVLVMFSGALALVLDPWLRATPAISSLVASVSAVARPEHHQFAAVGWIGPYWLWAPLDHPMWLVVISRPEMIGALAAPWLVILAAWVRPGAARRPPAVAVAVRLALAAGAAYLLLGTVALRLAAHAFVAPATRGSTDFAVVFNQWEIMLAVLLQTVAAVAVTAVILRRDHRDPFAPVFGQLAAFVTGTVAVAAAIAGWTAGPCVSWLNVSGRCDASVDLQLTAFMLRRFLVEGAFVAVAATFAVTLTARAASAVRRGGRTRRLTSAAPAAPAAPAADPAADPGGHATEPTEKPAASPTGGPVAAPAAGSDTAPGAQPRPAGRSSRGVAILPVVLLVLAEVIAIRYR